MSLYLKAMQVQKRYGAFVALRDASLSLQEGETLALLGPNGAGKTTLIKILATLLTRDGGRVEIMGYDLDRHADEIRHLVGYVGQDTERSAYARLTVVENLRFFGRLRGMGKQLIEQQIEKLAASFEFADNLGRQFVTLSGGQKQTMVIMRAFLHDPPLVYLDEPTKGLDPIVARKIRSYLGRVVREEGKSLLLTSHILTEVDEMADRVALIHRGGIPVLGSPAELKAALGAREYVELRCNDTHHGLAPATADRILHLAPVVSSLEREPGWVSFGVTDALAGAEAIIRVLREDGVEARFRQHTVSLEDAFMWHIGELAEKFDS
jgi:ABC-2 type transport system ATP-binding protein